MKDMIISAVSEYRSDKLKCWVNSIERCGFDGLKSVIAFNILDETVDFLNAHDFDVILATNTRNANDDGYLFAEGLTHQVPTLRHYFYWKYLKDMQGLRYIISTDISDVIFQSNPSFWLQENLGSKKLNYGCEGLMYKDEPWGNGSMMHCFGPDIHSTMANMPIYNAGSMAGEHKAFVDFSLTVALFASEPSQRNPTPDQSAVNVALSLGPFKEMTKFNDHDVNWACECGTTVDPVKIGAFRHNLLNPEPKFDGKHVYTSDDQLYCIVHQYNRVPEWKKVIEETYGK